MQPDQPVKLDQIGQIAIPVRDLERAESFYRDVLGMRHLFTFPNLAFFDCGGLRLMLSVPEPGQTAAGSVIYYRVENLDAAFEDLQSRGVRFEDTPHLIAEMDTYDLWMAFLRDSEDNVLGLMSEVERTAPGSSKA